MTTIPEALQRYNRYFCYMCGKMLPDRCSEMVLNCSLCKTQTYLSWFSNISFEYSFGLDAEAAPINVNSEAEDVIDAQYRELVSKAQKILRDEAKDKDLGIGEMEENVPSINRDCNNCGHQRMSYVTMQTRSADEGQTVFYTCLNCHKKEIEYS